MVLEKINKWKSVFVSRVWKFKGLRANRDKGRRTIYVGEDAKHILLDCLETRNWRRKIANEK
jgi:hypothetical protein